ncbi:hypothetical protein [Blastococcus sp. SYSU D00868]
MVVVGLVRDDDARDDPARDAADRAPVTGPADAPTALLDWLRTELPEDGAVAAAPQVREVLLRAGADAAALTDPPRGADPLLALVETPPPGSRLLARFDRPGAAALLLVDLAPVEPTEEQRRRREALAAAVLANPTTRAEGGAREVLAGGDVDPRLLSLVAALTAQEGVGLWSFPAAPGEEAGSAPARRVVVDAVGGRPVPADGAATERLVAWLDAQRPPFAPDSVEVTGDGVLIGFRYAPGPDAVVGTAAP